MKIGPKYKIARRLGAAVFEKTQTAKFALHEQKKVRNVRRRGTVSGYGQQLLEKQKVRFTYGITEKQLKNYVNKAIKTSPSNQSEILYKFLEARLDNVVLRAGFASTRQQARQLVSHGHFTVDGTRVNIASYTVKKGNIIAIRAGSTTKKIFEEVAKNMTEANHPNWLKANAKDNSIEITGEAVFNPQELHFDLNSVMQYYKR